MIEELKAIADDFCFICKSKKDGCNSTSFKALSNGYIKCEFCGTKYGFTSSFDGWVKIVTPKKKKDKAVITNKKDEEPD